MTAVTPNFMIDAWNEVYAKFADKGRTDWEKLNLCDLGRFIDICGLNLHNVYRVLDIGCGRAVRLLLAVLGNPDLNRRGVEIVGIDVSAKAVDFATRIVANLQQDANYPEEFLDDFSRYLAAEGRPLLNCNMKFKKADILEYSTRNAGCAYELVIDWMCYHEVYLGGIDRYPEIVASLCSKVFILNVFSAEGNPPEPLPMAVRHVPKHVLSELDIRERFSRYFDLVHHQQFERNETPTLRHDDGAIAAKRAYLLVRK